MSVQSAGLVARADQRPREGFDDPTKGNASWFTLFSSEMTPTKDMSVGIMEIIPDGGCLKPHRHQQAEIYFVFEGAGIVTIDGVESAITVGSTVYIPGDAEHSVRNYHQATLKIFYVFPTDSFTEVVYRFPDAP